MTKRIIKGMLCAALSMSMAFGSVMVGASEKAQISEGKIESMALKGQEAQPLESVEGTVANKKTKATGNVPYTVATNIWSVTNWNSFAYASANTAFDGATTSYEEVKVATVKVNVTGTVVVRYMLALNGQTQNGVEGLALRSQDGSQTYASGYNGVIFAANVPAGTYAVYTTYGYAENTRVQAALLAGAISSQNNRTLSSSVMCAAATGGTNYQYIKMKKKGLAAIYASCMDEGYTYGLSYYLQKKSGSKWKTVTPSQYSIKSYNYQDVFGLDAGTYRIAYKASAGNVVCLANKNKAYYSSYGTKKSKAKTISRKKNKKNTLTVADKSGKAHWYKIKVSKTRSTQIDIKSLGSSGTIWTQISGKSRLKMKKTSNGIRYYGKAKKGTYYIKVYKASKSTSGSYQIKYTK